MTARAQRGSSRAQRALAVLLAFTAIVVGCRSHENIVATLRGFSGQVERDHQATQGGWLGASVGATFLIGDALRTRSRSTAVLELAGAQKLSLDPDTQVRFLTRPSAPAQLRVALEMGEVTLDAAGDTLELETEFGTVHLEAHGRARLAKEADALRLQVTIGAAEVEHDGHRLELRVGDAVDISASSPPRLVPAAPPSSNPATPAPATGPEALASAPAFAEPGTSGAVPERGLDRVDLSIVAGESLVIHDPRPPTAVGLLAGGRCNGSALLSVDAGRANAEQRVGEARIGIALTGGTHRYTVYCLGPNAVRGDKIGQGTISVLGDSGLRRLANSAPLTNVDADGRRYTVLYQGLLPRISLKWPKAPPASSYVLNVRSPQGTKTLTANSASYSFASGSLSEGEHVVSFQAEGRRSPETTISIRFDNAAPMASIASPADRAFAPGSNVLVSGMALPGWVVTLGGATLPQDAQNRFSMPVNAPSDEALAIRFSQPQRGVHYYLRRSGL